MEIGPLKQKLLHGNHVSTDGRRQQNHNTRRPQNFLRSYKKQKGKNKTNMNTNQQCWYVGFAFTFVAGWGQSTFFEEFIWIGVNSSSSIQQYPGNAHMTCNSRIHEWCMSIFIVLFNIGSSLYQNLHNFFITPTGSIM